MCKVTFTVNDTTLKSVLVFIEVNVNFIFSSCRVHWPPLVQLFFELKEIGIVWVVLVVLFSFVDSVTIA